MIYLRNCHLCTLFHQGEWYVSRHGWMRPFFAMNIEPLHVEIFFCLVNFQSVRMCAFRCNRTKIFFSDIWRINVSHTFIYIQACAHYFFLFLCVGNIYGLRPLIQVYGFLGWRNKHWGKIHTVSEFNCLLFALHIRLISTWNYNIILTGSLGQYWWYSMKRTQFCRNQSHLQFLEYLLKPNLINATSLIPRHQTQDIKNDPLYLNGAVDRGRY